MQHTQRNTSSASASGLSKKWRKLFTIFLLVVSLALFSCVCIHSIVEVTYAKSPAKNPSVEADREVASLPENSIFLPGTGIRHGFSVGSLEQSAIDQYDIVYTEDAGSEDPFVLGHNTGTLANLPMVKVGQSVYIKTHNKVETYKVVVSEYGVYSPTLQDIIGQSTGVSIWANFDCKTPHLYTCHGSDANGRWIVLAVLQR